MNLTIPLTTISGRHLGRDFYTVLCRMPNNFPTYPYIRELNRANNLLNFLSTLNISQLNLYAIPYPIRTLKGNHGTLSVRLPYFTRGNKRVGLFRGTLSFFN